MAAQQSSRQPRPFSAVIQARLVRAVIDVVEEIEFTSGGQFTRRNHIAGGPDIGPIVVLDEQQRRQLLAELESELQAPPSGVEVRALKTVTEYLEDSLGART